MQRMTRRAISNRQTIPERLAGRNAALSGYLGSLQYILQNCYSWLSSCGNLNLQKQRREGYMGTKNSGLNQGAILMLVASLGFIGYAVVFLFRNFSGSGFELGVDTLNGVTRDNLNAINPAIVHYIGHLHVATAGFIAATGIAVAALSWYGVRRGEWWAWIAAVLSPVVGLAIAIPYHYTGTFGFDWVTHLGPIYVATGVFVVGALLALRAMIQRA
jgi:hypothetical protein